MGKAKSSFILEWLSTDNKPTANIAANTFFLLFAMAANNPGEEQE